jgi:hypothetical protein
LIYTTDRVFEQFRNVMDDKERQQMNEQILKARMALQGDDRASIEAGMFDMNALSRRLSEVMLNQSRGSS